MNKMNNKGFSLVELIVVIAIMAVLMGVLAPTLIGNIEKSRESKDLQNLDVVYSTVNEALASEKVAKAIANEIGDDTDYTATLDTILGSSDDQVKVLADALKVTLGSAPELTATCNAVDDADIYVSIDSGLKVCVYVATSEYGEAIECQKTETTTGMRSMQVSSNAVKAAPGATDGVS